MPIEMRIHSEACGRRYEGGTCTCIPLVTDDPIQAREAHRGDTSRMEIVSITPPPRVFGGNDPNRRSQAERHKGSISD